jgi:hypothetical protein
MQKGMIAAEEVVGLASALYSEQASVDEGKKETMGRAMENGKKISRTAIMTTFGLDGDEGSGLPRYY